MLVARAVASARVAPVVFHSRGGALLRRATPRRHHPHAWRCHSTLSGPRESGRLQWDALAAGEQASMATYLAFLLEVNETMNLTAVRNLDDAYERHVGARREQRSRGAVACAPRWGRVH